MYLEVNKNDRRAFYRAEYESVKKRFRYVIQEDVALKLQREWSRLIRIFMGSSA